MKTLELTEATNRLPEIVDSLHYSHEPVLIRGKKCNAVLLSEDDWSSVQESLYLLSVPNMRESITEGLRISISECDESLPW